MWTTTVRTAAATALLLVAVTGCATTSSGGSAGTQTFTPAASPSSATLTAASSSFGTILVVTGGRTVYLFAPDTNGHSTCTGTCAAYWPPVPAPSGTATAGQGVTATMGSLTRDDGTTQLTVDGLPVYTYVGDKAAGDTSGQNKNLSGGLWWVVSPSGTAIKGSGGTATSGSPSPSKGSHY